MLPFHQDEIDVRLLNPDRPLPLLIQTRSNLVKLTHFVASRQGWLEEQLVRYGALLLRGFQLDGAEEFEQVIQHTSGDLIPYRDRATPRHPVQGRIYTSTEYPPSHAIHLHNENSFARTWPTRLFFCCVTPSDRGGMTPLADIRRVYQRIEPSIRECFEQKQVKYVRNFGRGFGLPWQTVFNTSDEAEMAAYCQETNIAFEWLDGGERLRTQQIRPATLQHPQTGEWVWFNHAATLHITTLKPSLREALLREFPLEDLPNNTYYGDGSPIEPDVLSHIRAAYEAEKMTFPWQKGDVLMLDNLLVAHGREPYEGSREVWVGMAKPMSWADERTNMPATNVRDIGSASTTQPTTTPRPIADRAVRESVSGALTSVLAGVWAHTLRVEQVGVYDNFFELGGQSIDAVDVINDIQDIFQVSLSIRALALAPTVATLASSLTRDPTEAERLEAIAQLTLQVLQEGQQSTKDNAVSHP